MPERGVSLRQVVNATVAFVLLMVAGTAGFAAIMDESVLDALYRTVITVYTAGLVSAPETTGAKIFTLVLVVWGVAIFLYVFGLVIELTVSRTVTGVWQERRIRRRVEGLESHYLICGYGRMGSRVASEFASSGVQFAVLDDDPAAVARARADACLALQGDATDDADLERAGIARARGLVAAVGSDAVNLYIVVTAREIRPDLMIVARASDEDAAKLLRRGGADRTVSPYATAGREMATLMLKPQVAAFLDIFTGTGAPSFRLEQIEVTGTCDGAGKTIRDLNVRERTGAVVIAHKRRDGQFDTKPDPDTRFEEGDVLIGVGTEEEIQALEDLFAG